MVLKLSVIPAVCLLVFFTAVLAVHSPSEARPLKEESITDVVEKVSRAIVNIKTEEWVKSTEQKKGPSLRRLFNYEEAEEEIFENIGSGVVLDPKGIIVTNEHLIAKAINIKVKFLDGREFEAFVVGSDPEFDIAILKVVDNDDFPYLKPELKKGVRVGEKAVVIGNPFGLSSTVTVGVISALGRNLKIENRTYVNLIQTDASINPGSSGGALLDNQGRLTGIVTAIYGEGKGIGFAIPIDDVMNILSEFLESDGDKPLLGVFMEKRKGLKGSYLFVNRVIPGSPAERHGIRTGDSIYELNRKKIREGLKVHTILKRTPALENIQFRVGRGETSMSIKIPIQELEKFVPFPLDERLCGMRVRGIKGYPKLKFKLKEKDGVVVTKILKDGAAQKAGLRPGDIILKINNNQVLSERDFNTYMVEGLNRNYILYQIKRGDNVFFLPIKFDNLL